MPGKHGAASKPATRAKYAGAKPAAANDVPQGATIVTTAAQLSHLLRTQCLPELVEAINDRSASQGPRLLTRQELAEALRVSPGMVDILRQRGLPFRRVGDSPRFEYQACLDWIDTDQAQDGA